MDVHFYPVSRNEHFVSTQIALVLPYAHRSLANQAYSADRVKAYDTFVSRSNKCDSLIHNCDDPSELIQTVWSMKQQWLLSFIDRTDITSNPTFRRMILLRHG